MSGLEVTEINGSVIEIKNKDRMWKASVKWDGCIDFRTWSNDDESDMDYIHICSADEMIGIMEKLKEIAKKKFGEDWE